MGIFEAIRLVAGILPSIISLIHAAETIYGGGRGNEKLAHVLDQVETGATAAGVALDQVQQLRAPITDLVGGLVSTFNKFRSWPTAAEG